MARKAASAAATSAILVALGRDLLDQRPHLGGVLDVAGRVLAEVRGRLAVGVAVAVHEPGALGARDRGLAALDRIEAHELLVDLAWRGPGAHALGGLRGRGVGGVAARRIQEAVPERHVGALLVGVLVELRPLRERRGSVAR